MVLDIDLGMDVVVVVVDVDVAMVVDRTRMDCGLRVDVGMEVDRKFAELGSTRLKTDLGRQTFGNRKDLVIAERRNPRIHPFRTTNKMETRGPR